MHGACWTSAARVGGQKRLMAVGCGAPGCWLLGRRRLDDDRNEDREGNRRRPRTGVGAVLGPGAPEVVARVRKVGSQLDACLSAARRDAGLGEELAAERRVGGYLELVRQRPHPVRGGVLYGERNRLVADRNLRIRR